MSEKNSDGVGGEKNTPVIMMILYFHIIILFDKNFETNHTGQFVIIVHLHTTLID